MDSPKHHHKHLFQIVLILLNSLYICLPAPAYAEPVDFDVVEKYSGKDFAQAIKLKAQGKLEEAAQAFGRSISAHPENMETYLERANVLLELKKYKEALSDLDKYTSLMQLTSDKNDKSRQSILALKRAKALDGLNKPAEAMSLYKQSLDLDDTVYARIALGAHYKKQGDKENALEQFKIAKSRMHGGGWSSNWGQTEIDLNNMMNELKSDKVTKESESLRKVPVQKARAAKNPTQD